VSFRNDFLLANDYAVLVDQCLCAHHVGRRAVGASVVGCLPAFLLDPEVGEHVLVLEWGAARGLVVYCFP
jgi:hypothetical protein